MNPADRPSRRPDYIVTAQKEPGQIHKDLLAKKLVKPELSEAALTKGPGLHKPDRSPEFYLPEAEEPHDTARFQLCEAARVIPDFRLY